MIHTAVGDRTSKAPPLGASLVFQGRPLFLGSAGSDLRIPGLSFLGAQPSPLVKIGWNQPPGPRPAARAWPRMASRSARVTRVCTIARSLAAPLHPLMVQATYLRPTTRARASP